MREITVGSAKLRASLRATVGDAGGSWAWSLISRGVACEGEYKGLRLASRPLPACERQALIDLLEMLLTDGETWSLHGVAGDGGGWRTTPIVAQWAHEHERDLVAAHDSLDEERLSE
ncbi:hypothetical protein I0C86_41185 [Plantactinospora sp. S1510]|uniref:Uncharacterized protein n=1 Tax=Plantactinospora alkalitolerans TaxID=2789879 RepID=A0ABS0HAY1_9ACTN|nr:hypothetical protein [Plantactinospora alkalitolerans]MBF9135267.1 hypothetical protein [Plantactinospora alkalitolerans]